MTKLQNLLVKITRQHLPLKPLPLNDVSIIKLEQILILKTWSVYRKEIDGMDYLTECDAEEFVFFPNHKAHHQFTLQPKRTVTAEIISWDLCKSIPAAGPGAVLRLNGIELRVVTISDTGMVWVADGVFIYLRPAVQRTAR